MTARIWQFVKDLLSLEALEGGIEVTRTTFQLTELIQTQSIQDLAYCIERGASLLEWLNSPLVELADSTLPFVKIATNLIQYYVQETQREPTLAQTIVLVSQAAYLESFKTLLSAPKIKPWLIQKGNKPASQFVEQLFEQFDEDLAKLELDDTAAPVAIACFYKSKLAKLYNQALTTRLEQLGVNPEAALQIAEHVAQATNQTMLSTLAKFENKVQRVVEWYRVGGPEALEQYLRIDAYLEEQIKPRPEERVFNELFSIRDIYVPLKGQQLQGNGKSNPEQLPIELERWARNLLNDDTKVDQVMLIQGAPGAGKTVFCGLFADWIRQHEYPRWIPIYIPLQNVGDWEKDFEETLCKVVNRDFAKNAPGWLSDRNLRFLFLLDGVDKLLMHSRTNGRLEEFFQQVSQFQRRCAQNPEMGHRVLLTGRTLTIQTVEQLLPPNLERVEILPMDDVLQERWLARWEQLAGTATTRTFRQFLQDGLSPKQVGELAREPLLLYLLAAMHRDGKLTGDMFVGARGEKAKGLIYKRILDWVRTKQHPTGLNQELTPLEMDSVYSILREAGLRVEQSSAAMLQSL
jgi:hypothetical protein